MCEDIAQSVHQAFQDIVASDVCEVKTLVANFRSHLAHVENRLTRQIDQRFDAQNQRDDAQNEKVDAQFMALLSALGEFAS